MTDSIPPYLEKAKEIFFKELTDHLKFFDTVILEDSLHKNQSDIASRFHIIKGGAGFLQMQNLREVADEGEKIFNGSSEELHKDILLKLTAKIRANI
ncbi:MAG: Hpt domain-containing protein [Proteobacteria bacterium]|nr:Hpt domain-containing protein [Pseudomonadota bacterium]